MVRDVPGNFDNLPRIKQYGPKLLPGTIHTSEERRRLHRSIDLQ